MLKNTRIAETPKTMQTNKTLQVERRKANGTIPHVETTYTQHPGALIEKN